MTSNSRAGGEMDWSYCRDVFMSYKICARNSLLFLTTTWGSERPKKSSGFPLDRGNLGRF
jgi:hypothetical protein